MKKAKKIFHQQGEEIEKKLSLLFHSSDLQEENKFYPLLVSSLLLRSMGGGQIDLARLEKIFHHSLALDLAKESQWVISLLEAKSGLEVSKAQQGRLKKSAHYLSSIFNLSVQQNFVINGKRILPNK